MAEKWRDVRLTDLPEIELLRVLEDIDPEAMGVGNRRSIPEDRQTPHINKDQLTREHPEYFGIKAPVAKPRKRKLPIEIVRQLVAGQLRLPDIYRGEVPVQPSQYRFPDIASGMREARNALREDVGLGKLDELRARVTIFKTKRG